jgi:hypothetical protein
MMTRKKVARVVKASLFVAATAVPVHDARADGRESDPVAARSLFAQGRRLAGEGHYDQACPKFEESLRLDPGIGTRFNLADCWEHVGKTATAWAAFLDVAALARAAGQAEREKIARDRASTLEPHLSHLTIGVSASNADAAVEVRKDDVAFGRPLWDSPVPVDPGEHVVEAKAHAKKSWKVTVAIAPGQGLSVMVPPLEAEQRATVVESSIVPAAGDSREPGGSAGAPIVERANAAPATQRIIGFAVGGAGIVGLAVGIGFALLTKSKNDEASGICLGASPCSAADVARHTSLVNDAQSDSTISIASLIAGGAAIAVGGVLILTSPTRSGPAMAIEFGPTLSPGFSGLRLAGAW